MSITENFELDRYGLHLRMVHIDDAEFIVRLRTDSKLGHYIHSTSNDVAKQTEWLQAYKERERNGQDYYFVFEVPKGNRVGVMRIYDISEEAFTIGSWVFDKSSPKGAAILADLIVKDIGWELFPDKLCHWDINKENTNVLRFGAVFHPTLIGEKENQLFFSCTKENFDKYKQLYLRMYNR